MNLDDEKPRSARRFGGCSEAHLQALTDTHGQVRAAVGDLSKVLDRLTPRIVAMQTHTLDANGQASGQYRLPFECLAVDSFSGEVLTVAAAATGVAPGSGPGVGKVRPGGFGVFNFRATSWQVYGGQQGEQITITAYGAPQPPNAAPSSSANPIVATVTSVPASATSVPLFAPAAAVNMRTVFNDSTAVLYLKFGATASTTSYTVQIASNGYFEFPVPVYAGEVDGIWSAANGNARLTSW